MTSLRDRTPHPSRRRKTTELPLTYAFMVITRRGPSKGRLARANPILQQPRDTQATFAS